MSEIPVFLEILSTRNIIGSLSESFDVWEKLCTAQSMDSVYSFTINNKSLKAVNSMPLINNTVSKQKRMSNNCKVVNFKDLYIY